MESDARAPPRLVVGVMTAPLINARNRRLIRRTMFEALATHRAIRAAFVVGDVPCARRAMLEESNAHRDVVWINATDCHKAYGAEKVHAWYQHALHAWPSTPWLAKAEDDGLVMLPAVLRDLRSLDASKLTWYGVMGWVGSCTLGTGCSVELGRAAAGKTQTDRGFVGCCGGCFGGLWQGRRVPKSPCVPGSKETGPFPAAVGSAACPSVAISPFPMGPIEARSRSLAAAIGRCGYARRYFEAMSTRGGAIQNECASMDGAQGHAAAHCLPALQLADATFGRLRFPQPKLVNASGSLAVHPMKENFNKEVALRLWEMLTSRPYAPLPLPLYDAELGAGRWPKIARAAGVVVGGAPGQVHGSAHVAHAANESRAHQRERLRVERAHDERKVAVLTGEGPGTAPKRSATL